MDWKASLEYSIVLVEWSDPTTLDEWWDLKEIDPKCNIIRTCGFLIAEKSDSVTIGLSWDKEEALASSLIIIPKSLIQKRIQIVPDLTQYAEDPD